MCGYCQKTGPAVEVRDLAEYIESALSVEYDDPYARGAQYDKEADYYEDRFPGVTVHDAELLLQEELQIEYEVAADLTSHFQNTYLAEIDGIFGPTHAEFMRAGWHSFKQIVKHKIRFVFFNPKFSTSFADRYQESLNPYMVLSEVGKALTQLKLYKRFKKGQLKVYRARQHAPNINYNTAGSIGSPPENTAKANRMSPAGISMFYGAFDQDTCYSEICQQSSVPTEITFGSFVNLHNLKLIDFTKLTELPSIFDVDNRDKRSIASFILSFIRDLSQPVTPDDRVHIDYVPTQVVTEYFKHMMSSRIDGIIYNSVKNKGGKCVVLFFDHSEMADEGSEIEGSALSLVKGSVITKTVLVK